MEGQETMRKSRFSEEQIRLAVEQAAAGIPIDELCLSVLPWLRGVFQVRRP